MLLIDEKLKQKQESILTVVLIRVYIKPEFLEIIFSIEDEEFFSDLYRFERVVLDTTW